MPNRYFNNQRTFIPNTLIKSEEVNAQVNDIENGFDLIDEKVVEVEAKVELVENQISEINNSLTEIDNQINQVNQNIQNNTQQITNITNIINQGGGGDGGAGQIGANIEIRNEGVTLTEKPITIDFIGPGINAVSDPAGNVVVTVPAPQVFVGNLALQVFTVSLDPSTPQVLFDEIDPRASRIRIYLSQLTVPVGVNDGYATLRLGNSDGIILLGYDSTYFEYQNSFHFTPARFVAGYVNNADTAVNNGSFSGLIELAKTSSSGGWLLSGNTTAGHVSGVNTLNQDLTQIQISASRLQFGFNLNEIGSTAFVSGSITFVVE